MVSTQTKKEYPFNRAFWDVSALSNTVATGRVAIGHLKNDWCDSETEIYFDLIELQVNFNLNSLTELVATILRNIALDNSIIPCISSV